MDSPKSRDVDKQYNMRNPAVKRLLREAQELSEPNAEFWAQPLEDNLFEWHFTIRGAPETDFEQGIYHGRIILPPEYPMKPPSIIMLTPNGRFETGVKICLSISSYHPETWRPSWSIRTALVALISFMATSTPGAIGSLEYPSDIRKSLARKSLTYECPTCGLAIENIKYTIAPGQVHLPSSASAQRVFRMPHTPEADQPVVTNRHGVDPSAGDLDNVPIVADEDLPEVANMFLQEQEDDESYQMSRMYGVAIGALVFAITGLICRRLLTSVFSWDNVFN
jgi:ubiquitin-conjugating enzyme E2 J1